MPATPDISVRLTAQGVQDVVNAFKRVRDEAVQDSKEAAAGVNVLNDAVKDLSGLLPALGIAAAVASLAHLSLQARANAEDIGKLSEKTGASVETLSVLALAAHDSEVDLDSLSSGLVKLAKAQVDATNGSAKQKKAFTDIGISIQDLKTKDPAALFVEVAAKLDDLPAGALKAQTSLVLFGKAGAQLIPMLDSLGKDGFDQVYTKAQRLGLLLSDDMVASARAAQDSIHELEDIASGLATQFNAGFMPEATHAIEQFAETVEGEGAGAVEKLGVGFGRLVNIIVNVFRIGGAVVAQALGAMLLQFQTIIDLPQKMIAGYSQSGFSGVAKAIGTGVTEDFNNVVAMGQATASSISGYVQDIFNPKMTPPVARKSTKAAPLSGNGLTAEEQAKQAKAYSDLLQAQADNELAIQKALASAEESSDKAKYDAGLISLDDYYDAREARIKKAADAEQSALDDKFTAAMALPTQTVEQQYKQQQELDKIATQQIELQIKSTSDLAAVEAERTKAQHDASLKALEDTQKLQTAEGDRAGASKTALDIEIQQYAELLQKQGKSTDEISQATAQYQIRGQAKINFGVNTQQGSDVMDSLNQGIQNIQDQAGAGVISQISAQAQILKLQQSQLPVLEDIGQQMLLNALAAEDPKISEAALAFNSHLDDMKVKLKDVTTASVALTNILTSQGYQAFDQFFTDGISGAKSFGDALDDLASTFDKMISQMISQMLIFYALQALVGWIAPKSSLATTINNSTPSSLGANLSGVGHKAKGGKVRAGTTDWVGENGPELVTWGTDGYVTPNSDLHAAMASGSSLPPIATASTYSSSSDPTESIDASSLAPIINITAPAGSNVSKNQRTGSNGQSITDIIISTVAADMAKGGKTAQTMQSQYGLQRKGTAR